MHFLNEDWWFALESRKKMSNWLSNIAHSFRRAPVRRPRSAQESIVSVSAGAVVGL